VRAQVGREVSKAAERVEQAGTVNPSERAVPPPAASQGRPAQPLLARRRRRSLPPDDMCFFSCLHRAHGFCQDLAACSIVRDKKRAVGSRARSSPTSRLFLTITCINAGSASSSAIVLYLSACGIPVWGAMVGSSITVLTWARERPRRPSRRRFLTFDDLTRGRWYPRLFVDRNHEGHL